jgi:hypothetical protein
VFGQSGTAMPAPVVVTSPPIQIIGNVAQTNATAQRWGQGLSNCWAAVFTIRFGMDGGFAKQDD